MDETQQDTQQDTEPLDESTDYIYKLFAGFIECVTVDDEDIPQYV